MSGTTGEVWKMCGCGRLSIAPNEKECAICRLEKYPSAEVAQNRPDGGPAFPTGAVPDLAVSGAPGMSLRDWFAGLALQGLIFKEGGFSTEEKVARAWKFAELMLKAREGRL